jgi:integrase
MASIHTQPGRANYFASFRVKGKQHFRSTGIPHSPGDSTQAEEHKNRAQARAEQMEREARAAIPIPNLSARQFLEDFAVTRTADPDTARRTANIVSRFLLILGDQDREPLTVVSPSHALSYRDARAAEIEASTVNSELSALNVAFERAVNQGFLLVNPVDLGKIQLPESSSVRPLEIWELKALLLATSRVDWRTCIYIGFYFGLQLVDAAYRLWSDIAKDEAGHPYLAFPGTERKAARRILIHPAFLEHLNSLPRVNEFICPSLAALQRWTVDDQFGQIVTAAKLGPGVTFRCLRHTYARLVGVPVQRFDRATPEAPLTFPDIRVPPLPCQLPVISLSSCSRGRDGQ